MIRNVIFDWSGTLVDDLPAVWEATNHVFAKAGRQSISLEEFRKEFSLPFQGFYERYTPEVDPGQLEGWFHDYFEKVRDSIEELPHARDFLLYCHNLKLNMYILSTVQKNHFQPQATRTGFLRFIRQSYLGVMDKRIEIHKVLQENSLDPSETMFIGDMEHDIDAARQGGVYSCAVLTGYNGVDQLRRSHPDIIVEHLGELQYLLENHEGAFPTYDSNNPNQETHLIKGRPVATVGAAIFDPNDRLLMVQTHKWSDLWGIPGGKIKYGESSHAALGREIKEETGLDIGDIQFVLVQDCIHSKEFYRDAHFLLLNYTCRCAENPRVVLNEEAKDFRWVSLEEAFQLDLNQPTRILLEAIRKRKSKPGTCES